jgi:hypothetical protein
MAHEQYYTNLLNIPAVTADCILVQVFPNQIPIFYGFNYISIIFQSFALESLFVVLCAKVDENLNLFCTSMFFKIFILNYKN